MGKESEGDGRGPKYFGLETSLGGVDASSGGSSSSSSGDGCGDSRAGW